MIDRESPVSREIRIQAQSVDCVLLRNNSGVMINPAGRPVRFGLGNDSAQINRIRKSSDLIGWTCYGRFIAVETKRPDWVFNPNSDRDVAQLNFLKFVIAGGGIACFATAWPFVLYHLRFYGQIPKE